MTEVRYRQQHLTIHPGQCSGDGSARMAGTATSWSARVQLSAPAPGGEIIASPDGSSVRALYPVAVRADDLFRPAAIPRRTGITTTSPVLVLLSEMKCHRCGSSVRDFGSTAGTYRFRRALLIPRPAPCAEMCNWKDQAGPSQAIVNVEGKCSTMSPVRDRAERRLPGQP